MNMKLKMLHLNKLYKLKFLFGNNTLTYTAIPIEIDENFITFKDKFGTLINYNLGFLTEYEEIKEAAQ